MRTVPIQTKTLVNVAGYNLVQSCANQISVTNFLTTLQHLRQQIAISVASLVEECLFVCYVHVCWVHALPCAMQLGGTYTSCFPRRHYGGRQTRETKEQRKNRKRPPPKMNETIKIQKLISQLTVQAPYAGISLSVGHALSLSLNLQGRPLSLGQFQSALLVEFCNLLKTDRE